MDDRLAKALDFANYKVTLFNNKENIRVKTDTTLSYAINGGSFKASPELIAFLKIWVDDDVSSLVLIDSNSNPIEITDVPAFYEELKSRYFEATNFYNSEYKKLKVRSVEKLLDGVLDD